MATATRDATAAQTATLNWELGMIVHPKTIEAAAPKAAAAEIPNVKGSASGLSRMVCMCAPASERHTPEALQQIVFWTMGSFQRATWTSNAIIAAVLAIAIPITIRHSGQLTALRLGDERAAAMGVNVPRLRSRILILASLLAAVTVAFAGVIGFVGLVGPHVARILVGEEQRYFAPASAATGAFLLATAHALSITIIPGVAIPIGIITALVGVPVFVSLILTRHRVFGGAS